MNFSDLASKSQSFLFGPGTEAPSYEALKRRREIADLLMKRTMSTQPKNIGEGISMLGQAILARRMDNKLGQQEDAERKSVSEALSGLMGGGFTGGGMGGYSGNPATLGASGDSPDYGSAIASIESGGNYGAQGPVTKTGDRAYGKYQVMGANIPEWSKAALGQSVTPEQFLSDPKLQDAVFQHRFGQYVQQYGPEGAASAWFSGDPTPDGDKDQLGTSDQSYVDKFKAALGQSGAMPGQAADMSKIGQIMELMDNPYMSEGQRMVAQAMVQQQLQGADPMRSLQMANTLSEMEARERAGEMTDYQRESLDLERQRLEVLDPFTLSPGGQRFDGAGNIIAENTNPTASAATVTTNVINPGDGGLQKELDKQEAEVWKGYMETGAVAAQNKNDFDALNELITVAPQGPIQGRMAEAFPGFSSAGAAFESIVKRVAPTLRAPGSGSTSDIEYDGMLKALPALRNKPEANQLILAMMQKKNEINVARAALVRDFRSNKIDASTARAQMQELETASIMTPEMNALIQGVSGPREVKEIDGYTIEMIDPEPR